MHLPQFRLMFDVGRGSSRLTEVPLLLLTHGHLDHSSGLPYYISQRNLRNLPAANIFVPPELKEPLTKILQLWCEVEDYQTRYNLNSVDYEQYVPLHGNYYFKAFRSIHRVPSNGYTVFEKSRKLKQEFQGLPGHKIAQMKETNHDMFYENYTPQITFSGDTQIEFVLNHESVRKSKVLFLECTYIDEARTIEHTRKWGHIHLEEIIQNQDAFEEVEHLFLIHFSPRYRYDKICKILKEKLPSGLYEKTTPFIPRYFKK